MPENQTYELTYLISSEIDEKAAQGSVIKIKEIVGKENIDSQKDELKKIKLAYPIKKQEQAFLATLQIKASPEAIKALKTQLEKFPEIFRFILIKKEKTKPVKPKKMRFVKKEQPAPALLPQKKEKLAQKEKKEEKVGLKEIEQELEKIL